MCTLYSLYVDAGAGTARGFVVEPVPQSLYLLPQLLYYVGVLGNVIGHIGHISSDLCKNNKQWNTFHSLLVILFDIIYWHFFYFNKILLDWTWSEKYYMGSILTYCTNIQWKHRKIGTEINCPDKKRYFGYEHVNSWILLSFYMLHVQNEAWT